MQRIVLVIAMVLSLAGAQAQVSFKANANRTTVGKNEQFTVEFKVNSKGRNFQAPDFQNFRVVSGPNQNMVNYMDNYGVHYSLSYSYMLVPREVGTYEIGRATIEVEGETYRTEPLTITVEQTSPRADDPNDPYSIAASNAFLRVLTSKTSVYQGEPLVASYKLYFKTDISRPELLDEPDFTGFYKDNVEIKHINTERDMYNGEAYATGVIRQVVLIPQRSGTIRPGLVEVRIPTQVPSNRRDFFGRRVTQTVNQTASENFPSINVKPLPESGKPSNFGGAVGRYTMDVSLSREELSANESVTLKITVKGEGNLKLVDIPTPEIPNAFEAYDPKFSEKINIGAYGMNGTKTFEYLLIPRYGGTYKIPPVQFSYFDPRTERYQTLSSEEFQVKVTGAPAQPGQANNGGIAASPQEDVNFLGKDILYIKTDPGRLSKAGESFLGSTLF
ncbi:MAG: BatD family protein, partial [Owenweeksia sp.]